MCLVSDGLLLHKYSEEMAFDLDLVALAEIGCFFFAKFQREARRAESHMEFT